MNIYQNDDSQKVLEKAADALRSFLRDSRDEEILLLLSGGSSFELLPYLSEEYLSPHLTIGMLDERWERDPATNNFLQLERTVFYGKAKHAGASFISSVPEGGESVGTGAEKMENRWKQWRKNFQHGKVFITQGMGADGHTVGIMPFPEEAKRFEKLFLEPEKWCVGYDAGKKNPYPNRATATLSFLKNEVDASVALILGGGKKEALEDTLSDTGSFAQTPARIMLDMRNVRLFTNICDHDRSL